MSGQMNGHAIKAKPASEKTPADLLELYRANSTPRIIGMTTLFNQMLVTDRMELLFLMLMNQGAQLQHHHLMLEAMIAAGVEDPAGAAKEASERSGN